MCVDKMKNPLKFVSIFFVLMSVLYLTILIWELKKETALLEIFVVSIIELLLCGVFFVSFLKRKMFAWWVAVLFFCILFTINLIDKKIIPDKDWIMAFLFVHIFWLYYLVPKYQSYKEFCANNGEEKAVNDSQKKSLDLDSKDVILYSQNPLQMVFYAVIIVGFLSLYRLFTGDGDIIEKYGRLTGYSQQISTLLIFAFFSIFYIRHSILAWWIALLGNPVLWIVSFVFQPQPFQITKIIISLFTYAIVISYLVVKYRVYKDYITSKKEIERFNSFE